MNTMIGITIAANTKFLLEALNTLNDDLFVVVHADATPDIKQLYKHPKIKHVITQSKSQGLTFAWNTMYKYFINSSMDNCILCNDDVYFSDGFSVGLIEGLGKYDLVGPVTNMGHQPRQLVNNYLAPTEKPDIPKQLISKYNNQFNVNLAYNPIWETPFLFISGFCFAFSKNISKYEFSETNLFNTNMINLGSDDDLCKRMHLKGGSIAVCKYSYVHHIKAQSVGKLKNRDYLWNQ